MASDLKLEHHDDVALVGRRPTVDELRELALAVDWMDHYDWSTIGAALEGTLHGVVAVRDGATVGSARLLGDGVKYFTIHDVIVHPDHQGDGLASRLVDHLLRHIARVAPAKAWVGLFASPDAEGLYESHGFGSDEMRGMWRWVQPKGPASDEMRGLSTPGDRGD